MSSFLVAFSVSALSVIITTLGVVYLYLQWTMRFWKRKNIPYFEPSVFFGNRSVKGKNAIQEDFYNLVEDAKTKGWKYFGLYFGIRPYFVPVDRELTKCILVKDFNHFMDRVMYYNEKDDPLSAHLLSVGGEEWRTLRMKLTPMFTSKKLKDMFETVLDSGMKFENYLKENCNNQPLEFKKIFECLAMDIILSCGFGVEGKNFKDPDPVFLRYFRKYFLRDRFHRFLREVQNSCPNLSRKLHLRKIPKEVSDFFHNVVRETINYREKNNVRRKDFLQMLIDMGTTANGENGTQNGLTMDQIAAQCTMFVLAAYDTSSSTMAFALYELARHPEIQEKMRIEILNILEKYNGEITYESINEFQYTQQVINETLRKYSPGPYLNRVCVEDYKIPGTEIILDKGTAVLIPIQNTHYDENIYENPHEFNPDRFSPENKQTINSCDFLPFGEGPRICIALRFGIIEVIVGLTTVLKNFEVTLNPRTSIPIKLDPRSFLTRSAEGIWCNLKRC